MLMSLPPSRHNLRVRLFHLRGLCNVYDTVYTYISYFTN